MNIPIRKLSKKTTLVTGVIVLGLIGGSAATMANQKQAGADTSPLVTEVDQQGDKLSNHEARIANLETDTRVLQTNTGTQASTNKQSVPDVRAVNTAPATSSSSVASMPTSEPTTAPVVVTAYREIVIDADTSDCEYTYSDGTTSVFHWKTSNPQGSWMTDGSGQNGHWVKTVNTMGRCDSSAIGREKTS